MRIFRYLPPQRVDCLQKEEMCFSQPLRFNDPFDFRPAVEPVINTRLVKQQLSGFPEIGSLSHLSRSERRQQERKLLKEFIKNRKEIAPLSAERLQNGFWQILNKNLGILCFSAVKDSLLMWAHYASSHQGFVLEFDTEDEQFMKLGEAEEVIYGKIRHLLKQDHDPDVSFILRKSEEWRYEKEFRIIRKLNECEKRSIDGNDLYFVPMPRSCVKAVYLGNRMDMPLMKQISECMAGTTAQIFQMELHPQEFSLVPKPLKKV
jgi:hypothetical protein